MEFSQQNSVVLMCMVCLKFVDILSWIEIAIILDVVHCRVFFSNTVFQKLDLHCLIKSIRTALCSSKLKLRGHYDHTYQYKRRQKAVCCSLLTSTSSMNRSGELSDFERGLVIVATSVRNLSGALQPFSSCSSQWLVTWFWSGNVKAQSQQNHDRLDRV
jgi:hypothetical protein